MKDNTTKHVKVNSTEEAWKVVNKVFPFDYEEDKECCKRAGYPIYRNLMKYGYEWSNYICDLGDRLEVNLCDENYKSSTINVWISEEEKHEEETHNTTIIYELTIGLNDKDTEKPSVSVDNAISIITSLLIAKYELPGATLFPCFGIYRMSKTGNIVQEQSIRVEVAGDEETGKAISGAIEDFLHVFNQESIMFKKYSAAIDFVEAKK